ncbi:LEAF RUST 10 DISEASE-RESISTANCE LOCUS RECEPTOR-LIKE PROTEIN KINASE-like 2.4 isoform X1 [Triticum dicoccoides]|uniref:Protein kinase domain-containing protein n=1 Tax=Triticum aestivum TaxID=4565 RepID=A0A3B6EHH0_WHEAT|nr:LEAF RUST 10 DISEASE-RESISTANCE LOCUS RECEPTOR-LIKE PROTEIN KINASE-like 2.4 isoform X1 [Triticum dicoccoides]XP_044341040.1 LEAF RUST 10 DISEASE-RESISTANCE LOCUS RECEPTOR-LIKE PROTEIN KINASE-like 2.4 [Triticum aestivum]
MPLLICHRLLLLLLLWVAASHGDSSDDGAYDPSMCLNQTYTCGDVRISYPFYLVGKTKDLRGNDNSYCGYPGLGILCDDNKPILQLNGTANYTVKGIDGALATVSLADPNVDDDLNPCPRPRIGRNVTFQEGSPLYFPDSTVDYLIFFIGCNFNFTFYKPSSIYPISCQSFEDGPGPGLSFVLPDDAVPAGNWVQACNQVIQLPVHKYGEINFTDHGWTNGSGYANLLRQEFQLGWNESGRPTACTQCEGANSKGRCGHSRTGDFIGCLCPDGLVHSDNTCSKSRRQYSKKTTRIYIIAVSSSIPMLCLLFFAFWLGYKKYGCKRKSKETARIESYLQKNGTVHPKRYAYAQVKRMTRSFAEKLGQGGFGAVYRGDLSDGRQIAVKMLKDFKTDGEDFINELASISRTSHVNVVTLLGFCLEGTKRALIYDYMPNGSLERYAFKDGSEGGNTLGWEKLFEIAVGIARGLEYLHRGCNTRIVHFDIKPHNILLDQNFCPKISDFGLAKLCLNKESVISIGGARGTIGYIAPEVYSKQFGAVSSKSDVYSYGMMVLEMVGARDKNISPNTESSSQYFPQWIYEHLDEYCISASEINGEITEVVRKMIVVGLWCIQLSSTDRPTMTRVVEMLEGSTTGLELPPKVLLS